MLHPDRHEDSGVAAQPADPRTGFRAHPAGRQLYFARRLGGDF
jgi:hypothetical protein